MLHTFTKEERLCKKKIFDLLMRKGKTTTLFPFRMIWTEISPESPFPVKVGFSVSKRYFKKAVVRNRIKRRMREAYRKHKQSLYEFLEQKKIQLALLFIYTGKEAICFHEIEKKIIVSLQHIINSYEKNTR